MHTKASEYNQEIPHTLQTNTRHCEEEPHNNNKTPGRPLKQSNQLSLLERTPINANQKFELTIDPTMEATINNKSATT